MSRPGAYIVTKTGAKHEVIESFSTIQDLLVKFNDVVLTPVVGLMVLELQDYDTRKKILLSVNSIESIKEGGY